MITYEVRVYSNGTKRWYLNDKIHREDGPAVEYADGDKVWYLDGLRHREDGPAVDFVDGTKRWFLNGQAITEAQHKELMNPPVEEMTMEEICKAFANGVRTRQVKTIKVVI